MHACRSTLEDPTDAGLPALLMDIGGANCYELGQEAGAYAGTFEAQARVDAPLLGHVMRFVPRRRTSTPEAQDRESPRHS